MTFEAHCTQYHRWIQQILEDIQSELTSETPASLEHALPTSTPATVSTQEIALARHLSEELERVILDPEDVRIWAFLLIVAEHAPRSLQTTAIRCQGLLQTAGRMDLAKHIIWASGQDRHAALCYFAGKGFTDALEFLLALNVDVNAIGPTGSALHHAAIHGQAAMVDLLLSKGASPHALLNERLTPEQVARLTGQNAIAERLATHVGAGHPVHAFPAHVAAQLAANARVQTADPLPIATPAFLPTDVHSEGIGALPRTHSTISGF
jgi:hypothetical protein